MIFRNMLFVDPYKWINPLTCDQMSTAAEDGSQVCVVKQNSSGPELRFVAVLGVGSAWAL